MTRVRFQSFACHTSCTVGLSKKAKVLRGKIKINNNCSWLCVVYVNVFTPPQMKIVPNKSSCLSWVCQRLHRLVRFFLGGIKYPRQIFVWPDVAEYWEGHRHSVGVGLSRDLRINVSISNNTKRVLEYVRLKSIFKMAIEVLHDVVTKSASNTLSTVIIQLIPS